jgi:pyruvate, water dikinase
MTSKLERVYGYPVDTEFTASIGPNNKVGINLLQCRPMRLPGARAGNTAAPINLKRENVLFRAARMMPGGVVEQVRYVIYVDPRAYAEKASLDVKKSLGRVVGKLNNRIASAEEKMIMIGPGRWGSSNIDLGVNTSYSDINNTSALVEVALEAAGHVPELSYGTHFFLDLVESRIIYLPVYPDNPAAEFNFAFFDGSPNALAELLPEAAKYEEFVKVIDVPRTTGGRHVKVVADSEIQKAVCFLDGEE